MKKKSLAIYATEDLINDFDLFTSLNLNQLKSFLKTFKTERGFDFNDETIGVFIESQKVDIKSFKSIASVTKYIYNYFLENSLNNNEIIDEIKKLIYKTKNKTQFPENKLNVINNIFFVSESTQNKFKKFPYINSVIPHILSTTALIDFRTIYKNFDSDEVESLYPIALIKIVAEDDKEEKISIEFQTNLESLDKLIQHFEGYKKKLQQLQKIAENIKL